MKLLLTFLISFCLLSSFAQKPRVAITKVHSSVGKYVNNSIVNVDEAKNVLSQSLTIVDDKGITYPIVTYSFLFKRNGVIEEEQTGKRVPTSTVVSDHFQSTPLPAIWIKNLNEEGYVKNEEFYYFDIVVKNAKGMNMFAPDVKIKIQ